MNKIKLYEYLCKKLRHVTSRMHAKLFDLEWGQPNPPEFFDHYLDMYWKWTDTCSPHWLERGVFNLLAIKCFDKPVLFELCCGDGFNTHLFYSTSCGCIWACDYDPSAIKDAQLKHSRPNIEFSVADIRSQIPQTINNESPTNIVWDSAILYFTDEEVDSILKNIKDILSERRGILSGATVCEDHEEFVYHKRSFKSKEDLRDFLNRYFKNVVVCETIYDDRHNLYFMASDGFLPMTAEWDHMTAVLESDQG